MTTVLRAREPRDLLSYVPFRLGFIPRDSLVMVCREGRRGRVGLVARQDLPAGWSGLEALTRVLASFAVRDGAAGVLLVVYWADPVPPHVVSVLRRAFRDAGVEVDDVFHVDGERYRCLTCSSSCCPPAGRPLSDLESSFVGAEMVLRGSRVLPDREALAGDLEPLEGEGRDELDRELALAQARWRSRGPVLLRRRMQALRVWEAGVRAALGGAAVPLTPKAAAVLVTALQDVAVRDAVILGTVPGGGRGADACVHGADGPDLDAALEAAFGSSGDGGRWPEAPDPELVDAVEVVLKQLVRAVGDGRREGPLSVLAWLAWWRGDGARADLLVTKLLESDPAHTLGRLLRTALDRYVPPPWVRSGAREVQELLRAADEIAELGADVGEEPGRA